MNLLNLKKEDFEVCQKDECQNIKFTLKLKENIYNFLYPKETPKHIVSIEGFINQCMEAVARKIYKDSI